MPLIQKRAKDRKPVSIKINSMFWITVLFVCHVLTSMVRVIEGKILLEHAIWPRFFSFFFIILFSLWVHLPINA